MKSTKSSLTGNHNPNQSSTGGTKPVAKPSKWGPPPATPPGISTTSRDYPNPVTYDHPYPSMAQFADFLALHYDANRTRHSSHCQPALKTGFPNPAGFAAGSRSVARGEGRDHRITDPLPSGRTRQGSQPALTPGPPGVPLVFAIPLQTLEPTSPTRSHRSAVLPPRVQLLAPRASSSLVNPMSQSGALRSNTPF